MTKNVQSAKLKLNWNSWKIFRHLYFFMKLLIEMVVYFKNFNFCRRVWCCYSELESYSIFMDDSKSQWSKHLKLDLFLTIENWFKKVEQAQFLRLVVIPVCFGIVVAVCNVCLVLISLFSAYSPSLSVVLWPHISVCLIAVCICFFSA